MTVDDASFFGGKRCLVWLNSTTVCEKHMRIQRTYSFKENHLNMPFQKTYSIKPVSFEMTTLNIATLSLQPSCAALICLLPVYSSLLSIVLVQILIFWYKIFLLIRVSLACFCLAVSTLALRAVCASHTYTYKCRCR
jgi:hypothetical protein